MIWRYVVNRTRQPYRFGTPVSVHLPGLGFVTLVYQYGQDEPDYVVHWQTGGIVAQVMPAHIALSPHPEVRARAAVGDRLAELGATAESVAAAIARAEVLNVVPTVVG